MTLLTFDITANGKAVEMKTNDLIAMPDVDYRSVTIAINNIQYLVLEENDADGVNVVLVDGTKFTVPTNGVTRIGAKDKSPATYTDTSELKQDLLNLIGW